MSNGTVGAFEALLNDILDRLEALEAPRVRKLCEPAPSAFGEEIAESTRLLREVRDELRSLNGRAGNAWRKR